MSFSASAADVVLDDLVIASAPGTSAKIRRVEVTGTNLTQDELRRLFTGAADEPEAKALIGRLQASRIAVPEISLAGKAPGSVATIRDIVLTDVAAGRVGRLALAGAEGSVTDANGTSSFRSARLTLDDVDLGGVVTAIGTARSPSSARVSRVAWDGFEVSFPDEQTPPTAPGGNRITVALRSLTMNATYEGEVATRGTIGIDGLTVLMPKASQAGAALAAAGYEKLDLGLRLTANYDAARRVLSVDDVSLSTSGFGTLSARAEFGGIDKATVAGGETDPNKAFAEATLISFGLRFVDAGGFDRMVGLVAGSSGKTPATVKAEWSAMARSTIPAMLGGDPAGQRLTAAVTDFIGRPKSVSISARGRPGPVRFADLEKIDAPAGFVARFDIDAAAEDAAAAPAAPAAAAGGTAPATAELAGLAAWNAVVGNTVVGKNDDDEDVIEYYLPNGKYRRSVDKETSAGTWSVKGQKICFVESGDDETDEECWRLTVDGQTATFVSEDGTATKWAIERGNARNLH
jgi:hypothetical protein